MVDQRLGVVPLRGQDVAHRQQRPCLGPVVRQLLEQPQRVLAAGLGPGKIGAGTTQHRLAVERLAQFQVAAAALAQPLALQTCLQRPGGVTGGDLPAQPVQQPRPLPDIARGNGGQRRLQLIDRLAHSFTSVVLSAPP
ncbi:MAG: hypothetical protein MUF78_06620 [Candidatus Edwardsbacteria bacterium]|nr:hypothetical protein [Candidatus Edwardsbacteria bacterium]